MCDGDNEFLLYDLFVIYFKVNVLNDENDSCFKGGFFVEQANGNDLYMAV